MSAPPVRRIVTGHDARGVASAILDGPATNVREPRPGMVSRLIWCTDETPADIALGTDVEDMGARRLGTLPPVRGTRFCVNDIGPGRGGTQRTETVDYIVVLAGELTMEMEGGSVVLRAGDVAVQRGTEKTWFNHTGAPARIAVVLLDAQPLGIGTPVAREPRS